MAKEMTTGVSEASEGKLGRAVLGNQPYDFCRFDDSLRF